MLPIVRLSIQASLFIALIACGDSSDDHRPAPEPDPLVPAATVTGPITNGSRGFAATPAVVDLAAAGYVEEEFFLEGIARSYAQDGDWTADGIWTTTEAASDEYKTRILVRRPGNPEQFSGVVVVEWFNVTSEIDLDVDFGFLSEEILRSGHAWVGVTAQAISIESNGTGPLGPGALGLMAWDSARYESLLHPGDAYSYDIFSQVGATLRSPDSTDPLGGLRPDILLANGESQSAFYMLTYVNAIHPGALVYDGFLIHSRSGTGASIDGSSIIETSVPAPALVRTDLEAPVFQIITETDLFELVGGDPDFVFPGSRQPNSNSVHTWEVAGTAHADAHSLAVLNKQGNFQFDSFFDLSSILAIVNSAPQHLAMNAALNALVAWVEDGVQPASAPPIETSDDAIIRDTKGNALGGVRLPHIEVPVAVLTGEGPIQTSGQTIPFDAATLEALYPSSADYIEAVEASALEAVDAGFLLPIDAETIIAEAKANPPVE